MTGFRERYFVSIQPGLEAALEEELADWGWSTRRDTGGVEVSGDRDMLHHLHLWSRLASRVTVRVGAFPAKTLDELARKVRDSKGRTLVTPLALRPTGALAVPGDGRRV